MYRVFIYLTGMILLSRVNSPSEFLLAGVVIGLGFGGLNPSFQTLAVLAAPTHKSGLATSTYFLFMDIGVGIGSFALAILVTLYELPYHVLGLRNSCSIYCCTLYAFYKNKNNCVA
jgi:MFS family permease